MTRTSKLMYIAQILCGSSIISVFNPANAGWQYTLVAVPAGLFLIIAGAYGISRRKNYGQLPAWVRVLGIAGVAGWAVTLLAGIVVMLMFNNFTF